jgi:hypothetical protein
MGLERLLHVFTGQNILSYSCQHFRICVFEIVLQSDAMQQFLQNVWPKNHVFAHRPPRSGLFGWFFGFRSPRFFLVIVAHPRVCPDFADGNLKLILGFLWMLLRTFRQFGAGEGESDGTAPPPPRSCALCR